MLTKIREMMQNDGEGGFTLIELLVVVIIIGILAAIAIPVFLNQRNGARDASVKSDINAAAKNLESAYTDNNVYPDAAQLNAFSPRTSPGNTLLIAYKDETYNAPGTGNIGLDAVNGGAPGAVSYQICGYNVDSGKSYIYDSANGGLAEAVADTANGNCAGDYVVGDKAWDGTTDGADLTVANSAAA